MKDKTMKVFVINGFIRGFVFMVKLSEKEAQSESIFHLCWEVKQGIDCDSALPEGCVLAVWKPTTNLASLSLCCDCVGFGDDII